MGGFLSFVPSLLRISDAVPAKVAGEPESLDGPGSKHLGRETSCGHAKAPLILLVVGDEYARRAPTFPVIG